MNQHDLTVRLFGSNASQYLTSPTHAAGADLDRLFELVVRTRPARVLDVGTGAGHASYALARGGAQEVVAYDPAKPMLDVVAREAERRGHTQIETGVGSAECLPFDGATFELAVTRYSAHHWRDVGTAMREMARVVKPGGTVVVIDVISPENALLDTHLQTLEVLRDSSHVRNYRESEWRRVLAEADFSFCEQHHWKLSMEFDAWVARIGTSPARIAALKVLFDELPREARDYFAVTTQRAFAIDAGWFEVRRI